MKTARSILIGSVIVASVAVAFKFLPQKNRSVDEAIRTVEIVRGDLRVLNQFEGTMESETTWPVSSSLGQRATIVELAPEGQTLAKGDLLARFDASPFGQALVQLEKDMIVAQASLDELQEATLPLEMEDLQSRLAEQKNELAREAKYLVDVKELARDRLMSASDVAQQQRLVAQLEERLQGLERRITLTRNHIHPAALAKAKAVLDSAMKDLDYALSQEEDCIIRAPKDGFVLYKPVHIDGEFRTLRPGDSVYRNQVFMMLANRNDMIVRCFVPEGQFGAIREGAPAKVSPLAMPGLQLNARVGRVGAMAHRITGKPNWQKYVQVEIHLSKQDPRLRSGMSIYAQILSHQSSNAVLVPRAAIDWKDGAPHVHVVDDADSQCVRISVGRGNATHFEVLDGVGIGQRVVLP